MLARGTHRLQRWHCGIPSQHAGGAGGALLRRPRKRAGLPLVRPRRTRRCGWSATPRTCGAWRTSGRGHGDRPLLAGGSCINSFMSGGAAKRLMTVSALGEDGDEQREGEQADFNLFFLSPYAYTTAVLAAVWDYLRAWSWPWSGACRQDRPQLKFSVKRVAQRAVANAFLRDLSFFWLKQDMVRGVPVIYSNFVGYDDVAHHTGPDAYEAQITLAPSTASCASCGAGRRRQSPIRYDIVLLSDHGQTPSVPFRVLYGETIEQTLARHGGRRAGAAGRPRPGRSTRTAATRPACWPSWRRRGPLAPGLGGAAQSPHPGAHRRPSRADGRG